jgi:hypothetical protein
LVVPVIVATERGTGERKLLTRVQLPKFSAFLINVSIDCIDERARS